MKTRNGFVSNSSSSSFIVIENHNDANYIKNLRKAYTGTPLIVDYQFGHTEFGWGPDEFSDVGTKIIFAYLQYLYVKDNHPEWLVMLEKVITDNLEVTSIEWKIDLEYHENGDFAYIDHQSNSADGENTDMFNGEDYLARFLFNSKSNITLDNDNY